MRDRNIDDLARLIIRFAGIPTLAPETLRQRVLSVLADEPMLHALAQLPDQDQDQTKDDDLSKSSSDRSSGLLEKEPLSPTD